MSRGSEFEGNARSCEGADTDKRGSNVHAYHRQNDPNGTNRGIAPFAECTVESLCTSGYKSKAGIRLVDDM
eukprot:765118-Hanusia_phi.AAC.3